MNYRNEEFTNRPAQFFLVCWKLGIKTLKLHPNAYLKMHKPATLQASGISLYKKNLLNHF